MGEHGHHLFDIFPNLDVGNLMPSDMPRFNDLLPRAKLRLLSTAFFGIAEFFGEFDQMNFEKIFKEMTRITAKEVNNHVASKFKAHLSKEEYKSFLEENQSLMDEIKQKESLVIEFFEYGKELYKERKTRGCT